MNYIHISPIRCAVTAALTLIAAALHGEVPAGYYAMLTGKSGAELKTALSGIIYPRAIEYDSSSLYSRRYSSLPDYFRYTDVKPLTSPQLWWDMYSDIPLRSSTFSGLNREHSFPKSWWGGSQVIPAYIDLNHLYPSEQAANLAKSNYPLGEVTGTPTFDNGVSLVGRGVNSGGAPYVFEPADEYKGDFARTYFYMVTAYQNLNWKYTYMVADGIYPTLQPWAQNLLIKWHKQDPVSEKELLRNEEVYRIQSNRNPFIDCPDLVDYIWGDKTGLAYTPQGSQPSGDVELTTPVQDAVLEFGQVAEGSTTVAHLLFKGHHLSGSLELMVRRSDYSSYFSLSQSALSAVAVNSSDGVWLTVSYTPAAVGVHTARLLVQDGGLSGSIGVEMRGECLPVPELTPLVAQSPVMLTDSTYMARWEAPGEVVDYYLVSLDRYADGKLTSEELMAETNELEITGFDRYDVDAYTVRSVRLGHMSDPSNLITVSHAAMSMPEVNTPLTVESYEGFIRFRCSETHRDVRIYDTTGRQLMQLPTVNDGDEMTLPNGVYLIISPTSPYPLKAVGR